MLYNKLISEMITFVYSTVINYRKIMSYTVSTIKFHSTSFLNAWMYCNIDRYRLCNTNHLGIRMTTSETDASLSTLWCLGLTSTPMHKEKNQQTFFFWSSLKKFIIKKNINFLITWEHLGCTVFKIAWREILAETWFR